LWDVARRQEVCTFRFGERHPRPVGFARNSFRSAVLALSADGSRVAAAALGPNSEPSLVAWDVGGGEPRGCRSGGAQALALSGDGAWLASGDANGRVVVRSAADGRVEAVLPPVTTAVRCLAFSRDGRLLSAGDAGGTVTVWEWRERAVR